MNTILLIEADDVRRNSLASLLGDTGRFHVLATAGADTVSADQLIAADLILVASDHDNSTAALTGTMELRDAAACPIILIAAADADDMSNHCLDAASDRIDIPFSIGDLLDRIQATLSDHQYRTSRPISVGDVLINPITMDITHDDGRIHPITNMQLRLLVCLLNAGGRTIGRQELLGEVWGYAANTETSTIDTHVYQLRQKIERDPANPVILIHSEGGYSIPQQGA